jgi:hypothetical protein
MISGRVLILSLLIALASAAGAIAKPFAAPIIVTVPAPPWAVTANGKQALVYELYVTNTDGTDCVLKGVEAVSAAAPDKPLARYAGADLAGIMYHPGVHGAEATRIPPGGLAVVYLWVNADRKADVPAALRHRISYQAGKDPAVYTVLTPAVAVNRSPSLVIGPPLIGGGWGVGNGPSNDSHHRRGFLPIGGRALIGERFAIDWIKLAPNGGLTTGDPTDNHSYPGYGQPVIAVADGVITQTHDGTPDNRPPSAPADYDTPDDLAGNRIIEKVAPHRFALYAHLQPGSLRVKPGQKVKRGQVIGLLGNSGNSSGPHLHFHICDADSALGCEGLPYVLPAFNVQGKNFDPADPHQPDLKRRMELPVDDTMVRFGP